MLILNTTEAIIRVIKFTPRSLAQREYPSTVLALFLSRQIYR